MNTSPVSELPDDYCPKCASERPEEFAAILEAEERGGIFFTKCCARHAMAFLSAQSFVTNVREEHGRVVAEIGGRKVVAR